MLLSLLASKGALIIKDDRRIAVDLQLFSAIASEFIVEIEKIEKLPDSLYLTASKELVRKYLPEGKQGQRIGLPESLRETAIRKLVGSATKLITFTSEKLKRSVSPEQAIYND